MSELSRRALEKLLASAENAAGRGTTGRAISLRFSAASFPEYLATETHAEKSACNAALMLAERDGAIRIHWDSRAGDKTCVDRVELVDMASLARHLGVVPRWEVVSNATAAFADFRSAHPILDDVLACWSRGILARGTRPRNTSDWLDAITIVDFCRQSGELEIPVRRLSAHQLDDSKRIEQLSSLIDAVLQSDLSTPVREREEVFSELGLIKYPQTVLLSGNIDAVIEGMTVQVPRPYLGVPPLSVSKFVPRAHISFVLTIENLESFHEFVTTMPVDANAIVLYSGGMPSPSWKRLYELLLKSVDPATPVLHWGDIDLGGFRIASHVATSSQKLSRSLHLHAMAAAPIGEVNPSVRKVLSKAEVSRIVAICVQWGWLPEAKKIEEFPYAVEQEGIVCTSAQYFSVMMALENIQAINLPTVENYPKSALHPSQPEPL